MNSITSTIACKITKITNSHDFTKTSVNPSSILWGYDSLIIKDLRRHFTLHGGVRPPDLGADSDPESSSPALSISLAAPPTERQHARSAGGFRRSFGTTVP